MPKTWLHEDYLSVQYYYKPLITATLIIPLTQQTG